MSIFKRYTCCFDILAIENTMNVVINGGNESFEKKKKSYKYQYDFFTGIDQSIVCIIQ